MVLAHLAPPSFPIGLIQPAQIGQMMVPKMISPAFLCLLRLWNCCCVRKKKGLEKTIPELSDRSWLIFET